jgi:hypothetical protein
MITFYRLIIRIFFLFISTNFIYAAPPMSGTYSVGTGQPYTSLTGLGATGFFNAVNINGLNGDITVLIISDINETGNITLNQWTGTDFSITIRPGSATNYVLSGNNGAALFELNGPDNLIIDGRFNGSGRFLTFTNTNANASTFRFSANATNNIIQYCRIEGSQTSATEGIIHFGSASGLTGNDNNTISNCLITHASTGSLQNAIVSNGSSQTARQNRNITIEDNEIADVWRNGQVCSGILLTGGSRDFTITGNSFYQTAVRTPASGTSWNMILINTSSATNINVSNNYFGGSEANCGGSAWTVNGTQMNTLYFIRFLVAGTSAASNVNGNTIANINFTTTPSTAGGIYFAGILIASGFVNVGSTSVNTIGSSAVTGSIVLNTNGSTSNIIHRGIDHRSRGNISNNIIGGIQVGGTNNQLVRLECILYSGNPALTTDISGNIIGSTTVANSIKQTSSSFAFQLTGIHSEITTQTVNITNNTISNLVETNTNSSSRIRGIFQARGTTSPLNILNNIVTDLYCASSETDRYPENASLLGIFSGSSSTSQLISGNIITGLYGTGNSNSYVMGFSFYNNLAKGTFENNKISNLNHSSTTGAPKIWAINGFWGSWNIFNNQISITNGEVAADNKNIIVNTGSQISGLNYQTDAVINSPEVLENLAMDVIAIDLNEMKKPDIYREDASTNGVEIKGIHDEAEFPCVYYYNSVYIGGSATTGNVISWAYDRPLLAWATPAILRNNIFFNARTGGTGKHYALGNEVGAENWINTSADYNLYISSNINTIATWGTLDRTIEQWRVSSSGDKHTWSTTSSVINPSNLFINISTGDLKINTSNWQAWIVSGKALAIAGMTTDAEGNPRPSVISSGCPDIGSHEFTATPPGNPVASFNNSPGSGVTSTYSIWGRTLATIVWGTGGSYPSALNVQYYSGVNPPDVLGGGYSNSYWSINPVGTFSGTTYDVTIHFGGNETYTISSPSLNTRLAKHNGTWEVFSTPGNGNWQSELNWVSETVKSRGMTGFSNFALTDGTDPLPVEICSFDAFVNNRDVDLTWSTCTEVNNKGFDIEKRTWNTLDNEYSSWVKAGYVDGNGTTNEPQYYRFSDKKLSSGKYQYRLKQIDLNGNFEYHNLSDPSDVIIGNPGNADLFQNYPNPSNPISKVDFQLPFDANVSLKVFDITGKEVLVLVNKDLVSGFYTAEFNGSNLASGVYFYRLTANSNDGNSFSKTMKLILVK